MLPLLHIDHLQISFRQDEGGHIAVHNSSFDLPKGSLTAIVGESGSGKSITALSILGLLSKQAVATGKVLFSEDGQHSTDLISASPETMSHVRGNKIAMIFQEPMTSLNPLYTCGDQVMETIRRHKKVSKAEARAQTIQLFEQVSLPDPAAMLNRFPHQVSGGQKQRVMIAMAMSCQPALLIADEPTTALDVRVQKSILELLKKIQREQGMSVLMITHDLSLVADMADEIIVMHKGAIVEKGNALQVLQNPQHPYTKALLACRPAANSKGKRLPVISDFLFGNEHPAAPALPPLPPVTSEAVLIVEDLSVHYPAPKKLFAKAAPPFKAVDAVSFRVFKNETVGLVGESGCGKTTLGRSLLHLIQPTSGKIILNDKDISTLTPKELKVVRQDLQIVFQDPYGSLNPRITIGEAIMEPMRVHGMLNNKKQRKEKVADLLSKVNLSADLAGRYPHQFSGGQRQRICIARALALDPSFIIFDESVSALDVSVQAQVLNLINELKASLNFTAIFISHDLSVVHYISDRIMVMNKGKIVEQGPADDLFFHPKHAYTQQLLNAIPGTQAI